MMSDIKKNSLNEKETSFRNSSGNGWDFLDFDDELDWDEDIIETPSEPAAPETFEEKLQNYDPQKKITQTGLNYIKQLYALNEDIFETLNPSLLKPEYTKQFSFRQFARMACDKSFQDKLLSLDDNRYKLFTECLKTAAAHEENPISSTGTLLDGLLKPQFAELVQNSANGSCPDFETLNLILSSDDNYFDITTPKQLKNYHQIKNMVCTQILTAPENNKHLSPALKNMSPIERIKFARCEQDYGISLSQAKLLCQKYGWTILNSDEKTGDKQNHTMLKSLTELIKAQTIDSALNVKFAVRENKNQPFYEIDNQFRNNFADMYNQTFYHPREQDKTGTETINGKQIPVYDAGVRFAMCSHVVGAFSQSGEGDMTYKEKWNRPLMQSHVFCTRFIANDALETAGEKSVCYGFTDFDKNTLIASAPWDMASIQFNTMFDTAGEMDKNKSMSNCEGSGARFLPPREQINNTRTDGSETNWDRFDRFGRRKQPSYMIYVVDNPETSEYKTSQSYIETLNAASQFDIPLVMIDRRKVINNEHHQIDKMITDYLQSHDLDTLQHIIQKFENNRTTGYCQPCENTYKREFPLLTTDDNEFKSLQEITYTLLEKNPEHAQEIVDILSKEAIKSHNFHQEFCDIIYGVKDRYPAVNVDLNRHLENQWGITQKQTTPQKISRYAYKSFYDKKIEENTPVSGGNADISDKLSEIRAKLKEKQHLEKSDKNANSSQSCSKPQTVSNEVWQNLHSLSNSNIEK